MSNRFMIYADGGSKVCMGHIMRCMTLANALRDAGIEVIFATSSADAVSYIKENHFQVCMLDELNYAELAKRALEMRIRGILVDKFGFQTAEHQLLVDTIGFLVQIDDFLYEGPANLIINTAIDKKPENAHGEWLVGGDYAIIREQFVQKNKRIKEKPTDILLTTGFADPGNIHLSVLNCILDITPQINMHIVAGGGYETLDTLREMERRNSRIRIYQHLTDLSELMRRCDMAVTAAGTTLYELAAAGVPAIAIALYDNQLDNIQRVEKKGCIESLGWFENFEEQKFGDVFQSLYSSVQKRAGLSERGNAWIDGMGANRIAVRILEIMEKGTL